MTDAANNDAAGTPAARRGFFGRLWDRFRRPHATMAFGSILVLGVAVGVLGWGGFNWGMELTNTETFCISCHEMKDNVYAEYRTTIHYSNRSGVRATCPDCHVPKDWTHKIIRKIQASNEVWHHLLGSIDTPEKYNAKRAQLAANEWARMKRTDSRECRNCHNFDYMDFTKQETRAGKQHQTAVDQGKTCIDCHQGIAHRLPQGGRESYEELMKTLKSEAAPETPAQQQKSYAQNLPKQ